jgi:hypothetical protein
MFNATETWDDHDALRDHLSASRTPVRAVLPKAWRTGDHSLAGSGSLNGHGEEALEMILIRPLQAAGLLVLMLGLSGCGYSYSLEERIAALRASGYNVEPRKPKKPHAQRRKRAQLRTASEDPTLTTQI